MVEALGNTYQQEWNSLFHTKYYLESLRSSGVKGKLRNSHFRSICWKVLLECLPDDHQQWIETTKMQRKHYDEILDKYHVNPRKLEESMDINVNNPLSQSQQSPWNQYFQDTELKITIQQDVVRTFPEIEFFHSSQIQEMMINILFSYAREYPHVSYKQGMHELLAPIIFVLHYDQQAYLEISKTDNLDLDIRIMLNQNYIEHDAFFLFSHLMEAVEAWYTMTESPYYKNVTVVSSEPFSESLSSPINSLGVKLKNIYKHLLKHHDVELFLYLEQMEITPQIYGIRWLRLLFGREFPIHDLLVIWDAIFADSISFDLVDYLFVAMLIAIRDLLLKSDYASCLHHLMHYPNVADVQYIIDLALHLRDPGMAKPDFCLMQVSEVPQGRSVKENKTSFVKSGFPKSVFSSQSKPIFANKTVDTRPKSLKIAGINNSFKDTAADNFPGKLVKTFEKLEINACEIAEPCESRGSEEIVEAFQTAENRGNYNTFPRASIRNVMESKDMKFRALEVSQSFGHVEGRKGITSGSLYKEMVPLVPAVQNISSDHFVKKNKKASAKEKNEVKLLKEEISELKLMNEYCAKQLTQHITKLQECMIGQRLLYEDEMFIALAGLKRARDILKRTVSFTEEVLDDDHINSFASHSYKVCHSGDVLSSPDKTGVENPNYKVVNGAEFHDRNCLKTEVGECQKINTNCDKKQDILMYLSENEDSNNSSYSVHCDLEKSKHKVNS